MIRAIVGAVALAAALVIPASAGSTPLVFTLQHWDRQDPVEQQSWNWFSNQICKYDPTDPVCTPETWVHNPTGDNPGCTWDVDDQDVWFGHGVVSGSVSATSCHISDGTNFGGSHRRIEVEVLSPKNDLTVVLTSSTGLTYPVTAVQTPSGWDYKLCGVKDWNPGPFPVIEGSNGGTGMFVYWTLTITPGRTSRDVLAILQTGMVGAYVICPPYP